MKLKYLTCTQYKDYQLIHRFPHVYLGSKDAVMRVLATHFCSIPEPGITCELSMSLVLVLAPRVFLRVLRFNSLKNQQFKFQFNLNGNGGL